MQFFLILWLVFALLVALFAALNGTTVNVNLVFSSYESSLALVILVSAFLGALAGYTVDLVPKIKNRLKIRELEKKLKVLEGELETHRKTMAAETVAVVSEEPSQEKGTQ